MARKQVSAKYRVAGLWMGEIKLATPLGFFQRQATELHATSNKQALPFVGQAGQSQIIGFSLA
ncbi:MAG: hypothetical protein PVI38_11550 [Desulfobacterales bacterium]|jgi:hypothetical protein